MFSGLVFESRCTALNFLGCVRVVLCSLLFSQHLLLSFFALACLFLFFIFVVVLFLHVTKSYHGKPAH